MFRKNSAWDFRLRGTRMGPHWQINIKLAHTAHARAVIRTIEDTRKKAYTSKRHYDRAKMQSEHVLRSSTLFSSMPWRVVQEMMSSTEVVTWDISSIGDKGKITKPINKMIIMGRQVANVRVLLRTTYSTLYTTNITTHSKYVQYNCHVRSQISNYFKSLSIDFRWLIRVHNRGKTKTYTIIYRTIHLHIKYI